MFVEFKWGSSKLLIHVAEIQHVRASGDLCAIVMSHDGKEFVVNHSYEEVKQALLGHNEGV